MHKLSIVIPAHNEEQTISETLRRIRAVKLDALGFEKEIIVVDDASTDNTAKIVGGFPDVTLIRTESNVGKGGAIKAGLAIVGGDYVLIQDADTEYFPEDYPLLLQPIVERSADAVFGSRFLGTKHPDGMATPNYIANRFILTPLANLLYRSSITDEATCYKLVRTDIIRAMNLRAQHFEFCPEVVAKLSKMGVRIHEVPIRYKGRTADEGKKIRLWDAFEAVWTLLRWRFARIR